MTERSPADALARLRQVLYGPTPDHFRYADDFAKWSKANPDSLATGRANKVTDHD